MASPRLGVGVGPAAALDGIGNQRGSDISFNAGQRQKQAERLAAAAAAAALGGDSPGSDDDLAHSERMPLNSRSAALGSASNAAGLVARGGNTTPSGFGLSSSVHPYPAPSPRKSPFAQRRETNKGHPVLRLNHIVADHPYLCIVVGLLVLASCLWLAVMPSDASLGATGAPPSESAALDTSALNLIPPTDKPKVLATPASSVTEKASLPLPASIPLSAATVATPQTPAAPSADAVAVTTPAAPVSATPPDPAVKVAPTSTPEPAAVAPTPKVEEPTPPVETIKAVEPIAVPLVQPEPAAPVATPAPGPEPVKQPAAAPPAPTPAPTPVATDESRPAVSTPPSTNSAADVALGENANKLDRADLDDAALRCAAPSEKECDWSWGRYSTSANSEDHSAVDLSYDTSWRKPQDFYTFQAGLHVSGEGTGVIVRIYTKDLCCKGPQPSSYFRITAHGAAQAASNPPLALGVMPTALGRGHQAAHLSRRGWGRDIDLRGSVDEERVLQTFLLLPDPGVYSIEVVLLQYNSSVDMISEVFPHQSKLFEKRAGTWINRNVLNARREIGTKLTIPAAGTMALRSDRRRLPLCGKEGAGKLGGHSPLGTKYGFPLVGRWIFQPPADPDDTIGYPPKHAPTADGKPAAATGEVDYTNLPRRWLVERSVFAPYFCRLEPSAPDLLSRALERVAWTHFTGDSNTRHLMRTMCELANGTLQLPSQAIPKMYDPPHLCFGPSSPDNRLDSETGLVVGSNARWVITYTNWFWGKEQSLTSAFNFGAQCAQFTEELVWTYRGWPGCTRVPARFAAMDGPGFTYYAWGSHPMEWGYSSATAAFFRTQEAFGLDYFKHHPSMFALTTATTPQKVAEFKAPSRRMRNNERLQGMNMQIVDAVMQERDKYATRTVGGSSAADNWIPVFDFFSPTHAAHEALSGDSVHFAQFLIEQAPTWLAHYMVHAPNFGPAAAAPAAAPATSSAAPEAAKPAVA